MGYTFKRAEQDIAEYQQYIDGLHLAEQPKFIIRREYGRYEVSVNYIAKRKYVDIDRPFVIVCYLGSGTPRVIALLAGAYYGGVMLTNKYAKDSQEQGE